MGNSEGNKSEDKKSYFIHSLLGGAVGVFIGVTLLFFYINKWTLPVVNDENSTLSNLGTIGDYFGGLINPLLGFVSFCALLYTIRIQMKSLAKQSEELELTREELRATKEELARSAKAQEESSKIFRQQQFESTFFSLLNQIILSIENFHKSHMEIRTIPIDKTNLTDLINKKDKKITIHKVIKNISQNKDLGEAWRNINLYDNSLSKIFILIYQLLKLIDGYDIELSKGKKKKPSKKAKSYSNILRSCLDGDFLQLFAINGCRTDFNNMDIYKGYIEKYALLEHMSFKFRNDSNVSEILKEMTNVYAENAFGNSDAYRELKNSQQQIS